MALHRVGNTHVNASKQYIIAHMTQAVQLTRVQHLPCPGRAPSSALERKPRRLHSFERLYHFSSQVGILFYPFPPLT